jgi:phosphoglycerate dehydrogenase-like enzyme
MHVAPQFDGIEVVVDMGGNAGKEKIDLAAAAGVRHFQVQTNGLDHVEVEHILGKGITLSHCPGYLSADALAQNAMMFILMLAAQYKQAVGNFQGGTFYNPEGIRLDGKKLAIIGYGASGLQLALRADPFGIKVSAIDVRMIPTEVLDQVPLEFLGSPEDMDEVIAECDILSVHLHLHAGTRHIIDRRRIGLLKPTAWVINVARGALIDEQALYNALLAGNIGGAGLDVFEQEPPDRKHPVFSLPNVYATPHTAGGTESTTENRARFAADNLDRIARGEEPRGLITGRIA